MIPISSAEQRDYADIFIKYNKGDYNDVVTNDRCIQTGIGKAKWRMINPDQITEKLKACENYKPLSIKKEIPINRFSDLELVTDYD